VAIFDVRVRTCRAFSFVRGHQAKTIPLLLSASSTLLACSSSPVAILDEPQHDSQAIKL